ncbi:hypothetical protein MKZ38_005138 [Zalerion maritima]|uniref:Uncharacterized protein n=1 Tax=Zalerion maritima TaxID=339359 RepID=A0AAD5RL22_9PEZI|nr:hypothetical protein MKZ38_005138 [Zalerion maritima]
MSASQNAAAMNPAQGEFRSRVKPSEPLTTKGHKPGVQVGNDTLPEFHAETYPPGTAPKENTFEPNPQLDKNYTTAPPVAQQPTSAADTLLGATSGDVHTGIGKPIYGDTPRSGKKERSGLEGVGASETDPIRERKAGQVHTPSEKISQGYAGAEDVIPEKLQ